MFKGILNLEKNNSSTAPLSKWEHQIRNQRDFNPVKHGLCKQPID
jgi:hypothetical protein